MKIGLLGTGAYGMALADIMSYNNHDIVMWTKFKDEKEMLEKERGNEKLLPGYKLPKEITITNKIEECIEDKDLLVIAIPAAFIDDVARLMAKHINRNAHILIATKGIEQGTGLFIHQIIRKHIHTRNVAAISGPSFAVDIITRMPVGLAVAGKNQETVRRAMKALGNSYIKLRPSSDLRGIEACGAIKNVIAIAAGMIDGLGANDSTQAMLLTEAIHDMMNILEAFHAKRKTVTTFAGLGDLLLTCTSVKSRNYRFGQLIGNGATQKEIKKYIDNTTVEGYYTLESIYQLLKHKKVSIPIIDLIYDIVIEGKSPEKLLTFLVEKD